MVHSVGSAEHHGHHVVPRKTLLRVFLTLMVLTVLTVGAALVDLGPINTPLALAIAVAKAALVVMIFMGLKYDSPMNTLVFSVGSIFVVVFLTFTLFDTLYRGDLGNVASETIADTQRREKALLGNTPAAPAAAAPAVADSAAADTTAAAADTTKADTTKTAPRPTP